MRSKFEDKVAKLAFGDLSPDDAVKIEKEVQNDPEARRALSLYRDMRYGLRELSEIPEDQFSKERLRDAILTQGLKPVANKPISPRSWLWMPSAAFVVGFAMMIAVNMKHHRSGQTNIVVQPPKNYVLGAPIVPRFHGFGGSTPVASIAAKKSKLVVENDASMPTTDPDEVDDRLLAHIDNGIDDSAYDPDLGNTTSAPVQKQGIISTVATIAGGVKQVGANPASSIVLIDQDKDDQTGAYKATEVSSSSNVLVGG